jgi:hypothetical protein
MAKAEMSKAAQEQAKNAKRKAWVGDWERSFSTPPIAKKHVRQKYDLDPDTLECPICSEAFSPPVYQVLTFPWGATAISFSYFTFSVVAAMAV